MINGTSGYGYKGYLGEESISSTVYTRQMLHVTEHWEGKKERKYNSISICVYKINQFCRKSEKGLHSSTFAGLKSDDTYNEGRCSE